MNKYRYDNKWIEEKQSKGEVDLVQKVESIIFQVLSKTDFRHT